MKAVIKIKIRGYHIDFYGHVNNTRYLEFLEEARWAMKDQHFHFFDKHHKKFGLVVVNNTIDYLAPALLGDTLRIESWISNIGTKSLCIRHDILKENSKKAIVRAKATFVFFDLEKNKSEQLPKELIKNFNNLLIINE
jgi:thioesterase-3